MKHRLVILALIALACLPLMPLRAQVEQVFSDTISNSGALQYTRIYGTVTVQGVDGMDLVISTYDTTNMRVRLIAVGFIRSLDREASADTIALGFITSLKAARWSWNLDTLLRGTKKNQVGATPQTAWNCMPYKLYVECVPRASGNALFRGTSTVKRIECYVRKMNARAYVSTAFVDTLQNSGTLVGGKQILGVVNVGPYDSLNFIGSSSDSASGFFRFHANTTIGGASVKISSDSVFTANLTTVGAGQVRLNYTQLKALLGGTWLGMPLQVTIEWVPDASGNCELPVGGSNGLQPKWIQADLRVYQHRS